MKIFLDYLCYLFSFVITMYHINNFSLKPHFVKASPSSFNGSVSNITFDFASISIKDVVTAITVIPNTSDYGIDGVNSKCSNCLLIQLQWHCLKSLISLFRPVFFQISRNRSLSQLSVKKRIFMKWRIIDQSLSWTLLANVLRKSSICSLLVFQILATFCLTHSMASESYVPVRMRYFD